MAITLINDIPNAVFSENAVPLILETDNFLDTGSPRDNFRIVLIIEFQTLLGGGYDKSITTKVFPALEHGINQYRAVFNISKILDNWLMEIPSISLSSSVGDVTGSITNALWGIHSRFRKFRISAYEQYGTPPVEQPVSLPIQEHFVYQGGTSDASRNENYHLKSEAQKLSMLSLYTKKKLLPQQPQFVTIYNHDESTVNFDSSEIIIVFTDGTSTSIPYPPLGTTLFQTELAGNHALLISMGYVQLGLSSVDPAKEVKYWFFRINYPNQSIETTKYFLDGRNYECKEFIWYINSYGCMETIHLTGVFEDRIRTKSKSYTLPRDISNSQYDNRTLQYKKQSSKVFKARTGFMDRSNVLKLQEILNSNIVYWQQGTKLHAINIKDGTFKIEECLEVLHAVTFDFSPVISMGNYDNNTEKLGTV